MFMATIAVSFFKKIKSFKYFLYYFILMAKDDAEIKMRYLQENITTGLQHRQLSFTTRLSAANVLLTK